MVDRNVAERLSSNSAFALELEGVGRQFGALVALSDINLRVQAGERRAILGSDGAGKTKLFNAVTGDFPPTTGRIRFFSEDVTAFPVYERIRRGLRRTYQISQLFAGLTVVDSIFVAGRDAEPRPAAATRDRPVADGRAAVHPVRRAGGGSFASRTARPRRHPQRP